MMPIGAMGMMPNYPVSDNGPFENGPLELSPRSQKAQQAEYETEVHFNKCYGILGEVFAENGDLEGYLPQGFVFLDLGCAPGGFSAFLLEDPRCSNGFGVTLPNTAGGFPVRLSNDRLLVQKADLFRLELSELVSSEADFCICDAQYLKQDVAWDQSYTGVRCRSRQHGVWALLLKQLWLCFSKLKDGGVQVFRFSWWDTGDAATQWYRKCTLRLFSFLNVAFESVMEVKSDYFNASNGSFYCCCKGFKPDAEMKNHAIGVLRGTFKSLMGKNALGSVDNLCEVDLLNELDRYRSPELDQRISDMLERISKLIAIFNDSKKWRAQQRIQKESYSCTVFVSPVTKELTVEKLQKAFGLEGTVKSVAIAEADGDEPATATVAMETPEQARAAILALKGVLGEDVRMWLQPPPEVETPLPVASWGPGEHRWVPTPETTAIATAPPNMPATSPEAAPPSTNGHAAPKEGLLGAAPPANTANGQAVSSTATARSGPASMLASAAMAAAASTQNGHVPCVIPPPKTPLRMVDSSLNGSEWQPMPIEESTEAPAPKKKVLAPPPGFAPLPPDRQRGASGTAKGSAGGYSGQANGNGYGGKQRGGKGRRGGAP